jgi:uncharacterized repeat protein (TIGR01451 family)
MLILAKLFSLCRLSRFSITQAFSALALMLGLLFTLATPQVALAQTQITNTASITPPLGVTNTNSAVTCVAGTCTAADVDTVTPSLPTVTKTFSPNTIVAGGTSLLVITFTNTHRLTTATFSNPFVDIYPAGLSNVATPLAATTCAGPAPIAAANGTQISLPAGAQVAPNASCSISVVVTSSTSPQLPNTIPAGSLTTSVGANPSLVTATLTVTPSADMVITKTTANATPNAGGTFTYTIVIGNNGPSPVTNATWTDTLPTGLGTITNIVPSVGITAAAAGSTISGTSTLAVGQVATVTFQVSVAPGASGTLLNTATVTPPSGTNDPVPGNNTSSVGVTVGQVANLSVTKTDGAASVNAGGTTAYTITYSNGGPSAANGAIVKDVVSAGLVCTTVTCTATTGGASCPSSTLPQGTVVLSGATNFFSTGETIGTFPANSSVTLVVNCNVTATGQ